MSAPRVYQAALTIPTSGEGFTDITDQVAEVVATSTVKTGLCTIFIAHTSASLLIQENADPAVLRDLGRWARDLAPTTRPWEHDAEGPDDMPAHVRSSVTRTNECIPITNGALALGTWQALYIWEHRTRPHRRNLIVHIAGIS